MPAIDFSTHDPQFTPEQEQQCTRIVAGVRALNAKIVRLGGSLEALTSTGDQIETLLASLDDVTQTRSMESYRFAFDLDRPNDVIPFNPATGSFNPLSPELDMKVEGNRLVTQCTFSNCYESAPDTVQGGMVAAVYDQLLAYATMVAGVTGPTLWLRVAYLKPTPINEPLRFECEVQPSDGKKYTATGCCYRGDEKISEAEALMLASYEIELKGAQDV
jgi:acyl-coenzyme A thioesterase PaaI-like protein